MSGWIAMPCSARHMQAVHTSALCRVQSNGRSYKPWIPEPGRWLQYDWGTGPMI